MFALLAITGVLVLVAAVLFLVSCGRTDAVPALAGMSVMIAAAIPAVVYAGITSQSP
jgi:hypothetical protein